MILWVVSLLPSSDGIDFLGNGDASISKVSDSEKVKLFEQFQKRTTDLIIIADTSEDFNKLKGTNYFPLPWYHYDASAMLVDLVMGLLGGKIVICSKALLHHLHFVANVWSDFVTLSILEIEHKYEQYAKSSDITFAQNVEYYKLACMNLHASLAQSPQDALHIFHSYSDKSIDASSLQGFYDMYSAYKKIFDPASYVCQDINSVFVLLTPKELVHRSVDVDIAADVVVNPKVINNHDLWLGLKRSGLSIYKEDDAWFAIWDDRPDISLGKSAHQMGFYLLYSLQHILINQYDLLPEFRDQKRDILPSLNIFIDGHGALNDQVIGIQQSQFVTLLKKLDHQVVMRSLGCSSCFLGGSRFKELFAHAYHEQQGLVPTLSYPVIFIGSFLDITSGFSISSVNDDQENAFRLYFSYLNSEIPDFQKAGNAVSNISFDSLEWRHSLPNYVSIKYPGLGWVSASEDDDHVFKLSSIKSHTRKKIDIPKLIKIVLMNANSIVASLIIEKIIDMNFLWDTLAFLPLSYMNQNYYIAKVHCARVVFPENFLRSDVETLTRMTAWLLDAFFLRHWQDVSDSTMVVIEKMKIDSFDSSQGSFTVSHVCIDFARQTICFLYGKEQVPYHFYVDEENRNILTGITLTKEEIIRMSAEIKKNAQSSAQYEKALAVKNLHQLKKTLKRDKKKLPKIVRDSHRQYDSMSQEAKDQNIVRKKVPVSDLNPYAKPFYPKGHSVS